MAGIIGGNDGQPGGYRGVAPDSRILSVKVGDADGGADVSQVIAAIDWVVQHRNDNGMDIRVINLSYGTDSTQPYRSTRSPMRPSRPGGPESSWSRRPATPASARDSPTRRTTHADRGRRRRHDGHAVDVRRPAGVLLGRPACGWNCRPPTLLAPGTHMQACGIRGRTSTRTTRTRRSATSTSAAAERPGGRICDRRRRAAAPEVPEISRRIRSSRCSWRALTAPWLLPAVAGIRGVGSE